MNFRITTLITLSALLFGCASTPSARFTGDSSADSVLRNDVLGNVRMLFKAQNGCDSIESVNTRMGVTRKSDNGKVLGHAELWTVNGCGKSVNYDIGMIPDSKGETDFSVVRSKTQP